MKYMLDTNICIYLIKKSPETVLKRLEQCRPGDAGISSVTLAELAFGAEKSRHREQNLEALNGFLLSFEVAGFDESAALTYGKVRAYLEGKGTPIGSLDTMIGAHALSVGATVVTNNTKEFRRIPGLAVADWTRQ